MDLKQHYLQLRNAWNNLQRELVEKLSIGWEYHTQCAEYPVPDNKDLGLWESDNLTLRLSLIDHILKRLGEVDQEWLDGLYEEVYSE